MSPKNNNRVNGKKERNFAKRRAKNPFKKKRGNGIALPRDVIKQNRLRARFRSIARSLSLIQVKEVGTGVDYIAILRRRNKRKRVRIDIKFSFGLLGEGVIATRIANRRLINKADYAFAIGRNNQIHVFSIKKLEQYVRQNFGSLPTSKRIDRGNHYVYPIKLIDFYNAMKIQPQIINLNINETGSTLKTIRDIELPKMETPKQVLRTKTNNNSKSHNSTNHNSINNKIIPVRKTIIRTGTRGK